ncbi:MAG: hypothetical protein A2539_06300 [Elusimicrobia bacterium RIFOXYD2_FULL_34_15]|nr:MAG: hypothetical protein A2539_06300 [Elusimicrobia bacterium RIFOXYD2_FULL_34_15]
MILKKKLLYLFSTIALIPIFALPAFANASNTKLKNGVSVIFDNDPSSLLTAIQIWVAVGSVDEDAINSGISHYIEHTIFKGTKTRGQKDVAPEIERLGGVINAATSKDYTFFYTLVPSSYCLKAFEILGDVVLNPAFPETEIEKERQVVLEEVKRKDDNPQSQLFDEFYEQVYQQSPYARRVIGTEETVSKLKREDLLAFHNKFYVSGNIFVVITGNFAKKEMMDLIESNFGALPKVKKEKNKSVMLKPKNKKDLAKKIIKRDVSQGYILMGFTAAPADSSEQYSLDVASYILGAGRASRLNKKLVEKTKLALNISCSFSTQRGPGLFHIYGECNPEKVSNLSNSILLELLDLSINQVTEEELNRAKVLLIRDKLLEAQTSDGKAGELGFYAVLGIEKISDNYVKKIKEVEIKDIKKVISKYLVFPNIPTVIMAP